jgi:hypothetical protein
MSAHGPRLRHVLVAHDGYRSPGWYVVDTSRRPERIIAGLFYGRDDAVRRLAAEWPPEGNLP